jgi:subtilisin
MRRPIASMAAAATLLSAALAASSGTAMAAPSDPPGAATSSSPQEPRGDSPASGAAAGNWIVVLAEHTAPNEVAAQHSRRFGAQVGHVYRTALKGYSARMSEAAAARVADDARVQYVQPDGVVEATAPPERDGKEKPGGGNKKPPAEDPTGGEQEYVDINATITMPTGIDRVNADASPTADIDEIDERVDVDVAVIDTGVDLDHLDLNVNKEGQKNCSTGTSADDGNGHGTHVAGTIGAYDDKIGVVGMAPGARIWPVRVLDDQGSGTWSDVICGIDYVADNAVEIDVANMSLGGRGRDSECGTNRDALHDAICAAVDAGVTFVVAAGNSGADAARSVPAAYDEVITVSALADFDGAAGGLGAPTCRADVDDTFADFSNFGADVDLIAPGVCIESTWMGGGYDTISGTSMASPHVAGGAALYIAGGGLTGVSAANRAATVRSALVNDGNLSWDAADDRDGIQEPLLDVRSY